MTDMVEKVARAICFRDNDRDQAKADENWNYDAGELYRDFARAAIVAMREPTTDVANQMDDHAANSMVDWRELHEAFIDAALSTKEE